MPDGIDRRVEIPYTYAFTLTTKTIRVSIKFPIIAVTGSSGSGTTTVKHAFLDIFRREDITAAFVEGDAFLRYERDEMARVIERAHKDGKLLSHFGPEANLLDKLEQLFKDYSELGNGLNRHYVTEENTASYNRPAGTFTSWEPLPDVTDILFYEGLHGGVVAHSWTRRNMSPSHNPWVIERRKRGTEGGIDVAQYVDLLIGVVPVMNLEWIQKIHRDTEVKGHSPEAVTDTIMRRMRDYVSYIVPQFSLSDINFQRVPVVDTSNPFVARDVPTLDESIAVIRVREPEKFNFPNLLRRIAGSFMSRPNTIVVPGGKMGFAMEIICAPLIHELIEGRTKRLAQAK